MYDSVGSPLDHSTYFIDFNHSVFHRLQQLGVEVAEWGVLASAALIVQDELRVLRSTTGVSNWLAGFLPLIDPNLYRVPVERAFGVDLDGVPSQAIQLIAYVALTSLVPGQFVDGSPSDPRTLNTMLHLALGLRALQLPGRRGDAIKFLKEAVDRLGLD